MSDKHLYYIGGRRVSKQEYERHKRKPEKRESGQTIPDEAVEAVRNRDTDRDNTGPTIEDGWTQETAPKLAPEESDASGVARTQGCEACGWTGQVLEQLTALPRPSGRLVPCGYCRPETGQPQKASDLPEAAVEAALGAIDQYIKSDPSDDDARWEMRNALTAALPHLEAAGDARIKELEEALDDQRKGWDESMAAVEAETLAKVRERVKARVRAVKRTAEAAMDAFVTPQEWEEESKVIDRCLAAIEGSEE